MEIRLAGHTQTCLVDTGCEYTLIPRKLVPDAVIQPAPISIYAANGSRIPISGWTEVQFSVQGKNVIAELLVSKDVTEFLLGYYWLKAQHAVWRFDNQTLEL